VSLRRLAFAIVGLAAHAAAAPPATEMGAVPLAGGGVSFRVWAPHATAVHVRGAFNNWGLANPLVSEGASGVWSGVVANAAAGNAYKFFVTNAAPTPPNGTTAWRRDPYSRLIDPFSADDSNSVVYNPDAFAWTTPDTFAAPALNRLIVYEMHVGSFNAPSGTPATFAQAIARLDHVAALGANAVEVLPVHENPGANGWGYGPTLLKAIEIEYGGPNGFKAFVDACHARGLAVIVDVVYNHAWNFQNDMWEFDLWREQDGGGIWFFNDAEDRDTPWGPRFDYTRPEVQAFVLDGLRTYLDEFRVDGFRFDATGVMRFGDGGDVPGAADMLRACTQMVRAEFPGRILIAEDFQNDHLASLPVASGGLGFDAEWCDFAHDAVRVLADADGTLDLGEMAATLEEEFNGDSFKRVVYVESHDTAATEEPPFQTFPHRGAYLPTRIDQTTSDTNVATCKKAMLGSVLTFAAPGIPMVFMGQEAYETGTFAFPSPPALDWAGLLAARSGIVQLHRDLVALRLNDAGHTRGLLGRGVDVYHRNEGADVMAFVRSDAGGPGDDTVVVVNFSATNFTLGYLLGVPRAGTWRVRFDSDLTTYDARFGTAPGAMTSFVAEAVPRDGMPARVSIPRLAPHGALVISQDAAPSAWAIR